MAGADQSGSDIGDAAMIEGWHVTGFGILPQLYDTFVETGTYLGITTKVAARHFKKVYTIELNPDILNKTKQELSDFSNIEFFCGDSAEVLKVIGESSINQPFFSRCSLCWGLHRIWEKGNPAL
jgi:hypothetical protein